MNNIWLSASHIAGSQNKEADFMFRLPVDNHDYCLSQSTFDELLLFLNITPKVDLFVSRVSHKLEQ